MTILEFPEISSRGQLVRFLQAVSTVSQINSDCAQIMAEQDAELASRVARIADQLNSLGVDPKTVGEVRRLQKLVEIQAATGQQCAESSISAATRARVAASGAHLRYGTDAVNADLDNAPEGPRWRRD